MNTMARIKWIVTTCVALLSLVGSVSSAQAQEFAPEISLNLPFNSINLWVLLSQ